MNAKARAEIERLVRPIGELVNNAGDIIDELEHLRSRVTKVEALLDGALMVPQAQVKRALRNVS